MNYESLENGKIYLVRKWSGENNQYHIVQFIQKVKNNRGLVKILMTREGGDDFQSDDWVEIDNNDIEIMNFNDFEILHRFYDTDIDYIKGFATYRYPQTIQNKTNATLKLKNKKRDNIPSLQDLSLLELSTREINIINNLVLPKTPKNPKNPKNSKNPRKGGRKTRKNKNPKHT